MHGALTPNLSILYRFTKLEIVLTFTNSYFRGRSSLRRSPIATSKSKQLFILIILSDKDGKQKKLNYHCKDL